MVPARKFPAVDPDTIVYSLDCADGESLLATRRPSGNVYVSPDDAQLRALVGVFFRRTRPEIAVRGGRLFRDRLLSRDWPQIQASIHDLLRRTPLPASPSAKRLRAYARHVSEVVCRLIGESFLRRHGHDLPQ